LNCYFSPKESGIGVYLGSTKTNRIAMEIGRRLEVDEATITEEIGLPVQWSRSSEGKVQVAARKHYPDLRSPAVRQDQINWFRTTINAFVNALRPRISALVKELTTSG